VVKKLFYQSICIIFALDFDRDNYIKGIEYFVFTISSQKLREKITLVDELNQDIFEFVHIAWLYAS